MVSVLPSARSPWDLIGSSIGQNLEQNLPNAISGYQERQRGVNALDQAQNDIKSANGDPFKIAMAFARVGAQNPNLSKALGPLYETAMAQAAAQRSANAPLAGEKRPEREVFQPQAQQPLPQFGKQQGNPQENQNFPTNIGPQGQTGNIPQAATSGIVEPLLTRQETFQAARDLQRESNAAGIPLTTPQALQLVREEENEKKERHANVESERKQRVAAQETYGQKAVDQLISSHPDATEEQKAIFQRVGESAAAKSKSEGEINQYLATEAKKFKNTISNVEKSLGAERFFDTVQRKFLGTSKDFESASKDVRSHLKPLLDLGLYDTSRNLLTKLGYYPEERESIINPFGEKESVMLNRVPEFTKPKQVTPYKINTSYLAPESENIEYGPQDKENIKSGLRDLKNTNPNFSLVLARKAFEDKNYDWRIFKDALNEFEEDGFELTDDQKIQRGMLDTPPLNNIEKILHGLNLIGR